MTEPGGVTTQELMRRFDELVRRFDALSLQLTSREERMAATYLTKREAELESNTFGTVVRGLENETHKVGKRLDSLEEKHHTLAKEARDEIEKVEDRRRLDRMWAVGIAITLFAPIFLLILDRGGL